MLLEKQLPQLCSTLMRLRGDTLSSISTGTGIRVANLSVWLRGKEQVISAKRVAALLYFFGVEGESLRTDVLHSWHDSGPLNDVKAALGQLINKDKTIWLFQDKESGLMKTRFVMVGDAWVKLELTPGIADAPDLANLVNAQRVITLPYALAGFPTQSPKEVSEALLEVATATAAAADKEILLALMLKLKAMDTSALTVNTASSAGWGQLEQALQVAIGMGIDPGDIAELISEHYKKPVD